MSYGYNSYNQYWFTLDRKHGFGIQYVEYAGKEEICHAFYEDGTFVPSAEKEADSIDDLRYLEQLIDGRWSRPSKKENAILEKLTANGKCDFSLGRNNKIRAVITDQKQRFEVKIKIEEKLWRSRTAVCSCGKTDCIHARAAGFFLRQRKHALQHAFIISSEPVDKSLFLEPSLKSAVKNFVQGDLSAPTVLSLRRIIQMADAAHSSDYYWLFHSYILELYPAYDDYNAHFLEEHYDYLLTALFDDPGYRESVLEEGSYVDPDEYESRQDRSNRACFKRVLKAYNKVVKELDVRGDYTENVYKELLLKCREDTAGLLHYYAVGKKELSLFDLPFLELIAKNALPDSGEAVEMEGSVLTRSPDGNSAGEQAAPVVLSQEDLQTAAMKMDALYFEEDAERVLHLLAGLLSADRRVELYAGLRNFTLPMEVIKELPVEEQRRLINNVPLTEENFRYCMDSLLADSSPEEKGRYILRTVDRLGRSGDFTLKKSIADAAAGLPDSRLLLAYVVHRLILKGTWQAKQGIPEKELSFCFGSSFEIVNETNRFHTLFEIIDPESGRMIFSVKEEDGALSWYQSPLMRDLYTPDLVRKVCIRGREEEYRQAAEKAQDAVDAYLFEQRNKKFAGEYRRFCNNLSDEKLLFTDAGKVGIEWLVYREDGANALAFRVGRGRMYVVKDAPEFINSFKKATTTEYGRDLILTHETDNLHEDDAAMIKILLTAKYRKGRKSDKNNKRYITVSDSLLGNLFEYLTGRTISYNDTPCLLRMEPAKIRLKISSKYVLSTDLDGKTQDFLNLSGRGYLLTRQADGKGMETSVIDRAEASADEAGLIELVHRNPGTCVKPILGDFRKNIYSRFFEMIDVDKGVQRELSMGRVRLNTYFDLEKSTVTARTVAVRDGKELPAGKLTERIDQMKFELLENYLGALGFEDGRMTDESHVLNFFRLDFTRLKSLTNVYLSENLQNKELRSVGKPVIRVAYKNNLVSVFLEKSDYEESDLEKIIAGLRKKKKFILLSGDRIIDLSSETARDLGEAVKDFGMNPKDLYRKKTISMVAAIKAFSHERCCRVDKYLRDMIEEIRSFKEADIPLPELSAELRDYQAEGFRWLSILSRYGMGGILADDMGLGKTIQIIALLKSDRSKKPSLVVCPKSLVFNWISEFARFDGSTEVIPVYGPDSRRSETISAIDYKKKAVYITSYDSLRNDIGKYSGEFLYGILDEAQYIKNVHALKTKSVKELKARHRFALTGTPIENSVVDLWSIFDYIMPGYFEELSQFRDSDPAAIARKSAPFILRRVKGDVLEDLPPRYDRILSADMTDGQRRLYEAMRQKARQQLEEGGKAFDILPYLTRLRQICVDPGMFVEDYSGGSGKLEMLSELIPEYLQEGHRILIFSQFVKALESVRRLLDRLDIPSYFLSGATSAADRIEMMDSFNNGSGIDIFLISLKAGGTGLNLTGADTVIHLDPWWNVAAENQASDRTHRIGQTRNVEVIRLIAGDSIEQRVVELQDIKKEVIRQVISDDDGSVTSARLEDIAFVLE